MYYRMFTNELFSLDRSVQNVGSQMKKFTKYPILKLLF